MENFDVYNDDCLNVLKNLKDESVDLIVTDCPYHICSGGMKGEGQGMFFKQPSGIFNRDRTVVSQETAEWSRHGNLFKFTEIKFSDWLPEIYRVAKERAHIYIYINARNVKELQTIAEDNGFKFQNILIWEKNNTTPNKYYLSTYEMILMLRKGAAKYINNLGTKNILKIDNILGGKKNHPTEKPVELNEILIANSSEEGDLVLDPFMGSGSCGVAALHLNRKFIGVEIDKKYYDVALLRLKNARDNENVAKKQIKGDCIQQMLF